MLWKINVSATVLTLETTVFFFLLLIFLLECACVCGIFIISFSRHFVIAPLFFFFLADQIVIINDKIKIRASP